jgi:amidase
MKRRDFFISGTFAGLAVTTLPLLSACNNESSTTADDRMIDDFELNETTIAELQKSMEAGKYNSRKIVELYLQRIQALDKEGPALNSVIEINPDALAIADEMDRERKSGNIKGPLHGIPVLIKDNIDTADKMQSTAGAIALEGHFAETDSFIVKKLRDAGAVILGKTNLSEWANFRSSKSSSGWSSRGGQTKNPYMLDRSPCGSSSGSGAAVAANLCVVAIGTETDGSVTCPASINGIVGIKPTVGLVSRTGIIPISHTQDTAGPMARTVRDAAILLGIMAGIDPDDARTNESTDKSFKDYTQFLDPNCLKGKRIGIEKKKQSENQYLNALFAKAIDLLKQQGAEIIEISYLNKIEALGDSEYEILKYEFKDGVNKYLLNTNAKIKSLKEVIEYNRSNEDKAMPYFKQDILESCEEKGGLESPEYLKALKNCHEGSKQILDEVINQNKLDAICGITAGPACSIDVVYGDRWGDTFLTMPAAVSGYPHITVPCGKVYNLPVGLSFFGAAFSEPALLSISYAYEQASKNRLMPEFVKSFKI